MSPMEIALIVLVIAGIWAAIELALTLRSSRKSLAELTNTVNDTVAEVKPVVQKLDGVVDELQQSSKQLEPLLEKTSVAVDAITVDLIRVDDILSDVSTVTSTGANLSSAVSKVTAGAADSVAGIVGKLTTTASKTVSSKLGFSVSEAAAALQDAVRNTDDEAQSSGTSDEYSNTAAAHQDSAKPRKHTKTVYFTYPDAVTQSTNTAQTDSDSEDDTN
ncbi:MAG: DUF948 domain-containing protein [Atopobium sp.]|uniref:DUF948 domain-containing protein n=1 Tax=Atopobium sp. TaxID=1872650 RepID=UPI002A765699|nr:DUF948 domain-containing protein [Atopobium sp.]MDY2788149.1 DUF948 domain-containing protein [Atopobium sp.]MDY4523262.1 DUF948 domain-containing protein [Atopobium sp.]